MPDFIPTGDDGRLLDLGIRALLTREIFIDFKIGSSSLKLAVTAPR
jgi:hypothetical protein